MRRVYTNSCPATKNASIMVKVILRDKINGVQCDNSNTTYKICVGKKIIRKLLSEQSSLKLNEKFINTEKRSVRSFNHAVLYIIQGKFQQCRKEGQSSVHNFHKQCVFYRGGKYYCPHCGEETSQCEIELQLNEDRPEETKLVQSRAVKREPE